MPVSRTVRCTRHDPDRAGSASRSTTTSPASVNLTAFESRLSSTWRRRAASPLIAAGTPSPTRRADLQALLGRARRDDVEGLLDAHPEIERLALELELARLDLRVVEDVVDHVQERVAAGADDFGELALLRRELGAEEQPGHPDHRVHRRPDLVAHRRQERALRLGGRLRLLAGLLELADVVVDPEEALALAVDREGNEHQLDVDQRAVLAGAPGDAVRPSGGHRLLGGLAALLAMLLVEHEVVDRAADRLLRRVAEQLFGGRVPAGDPLLRVHLDHRHRADPDQRFEVLLLPRDLREQPRVHDRDSDACRQRREQARVRLAVPAFLAGALDADHPDRAVAGPDRHAEVRLRRSPDDRPALPQWRC